MAITLIVFLSASILMDIAVMGIIGVNNRFISTYLQPGLVRVMLMLMTAMAFLTWEYRVHRNLNALGARGLKRRSFWTFLWFIIPVANLFMPYIVLREIWKGSNPYTDLSNAFAWKKTSVPHWVLAWWISWMLSTSVIWKAWYINYTLAIEGLALAILFVWKIDSRQMVKYSRLTEDGTTPIEAPLMTPGRRDAGIAPQQNRLASVLWSYKTEGEINSSPAYSDETVFFGSNDHHMYALDAKTGEAKWRFRADGPIDSSPAVAEGAACFTGNEAFICVDVESGKELWHRKIQAAASPSPAIAGGLAYLGGFDRHLRAFDLRSGMERWSFQAGDLIDCKPIVAEGILYFGCYDKYFYALDAASGELRWRIRTGGINDSAPAITADSVFFGSHDKNLHAVKKASGEPLWTFPTGGAISSRPAVFGEDIIFSSYDSFLYAVNARSGRQQWEFRTDDSLASSPAIAGDTVYVGSYDGGLYAVDCHAGKRKWRFPTLGWIHSSPAVHDGVIFFGSKDSRFYAVQEAQAPPIAGEIPR